MNAPGLKYEVSKLSPLPGLTATLPPWGGRDVQRLSGVVIPSNGASHLPPVKHQCHHNPGFLPPMGDTERSGEPRSARWRVSDRKGAITNKRVYIRFTPQQSCEEFFRLTGSRLVAWIIMMNAIIPRFYVQSEIRISGHGSEREILQQ